MDLAEAAEHLGVNVASLEPAPAKPTRQEYLARCGLDPAPCSACGEPARSSGVLNAPEHGPRWLDRCRGCFLATPPRLRVPLEQMLTDLREIAAETGAELAILGDVPYPARVDDERYHLTLTVDGQPVAEGWWADETVARGRWSAWVGDFGKPGARVTLVDEETSTVLTTWPEEL